MKYYLHKVTAKKNIKNKFKITDYSIKEFSSYKEALGEYTKEYLLYGDTEQRRISYDTKVSQRITTTKKKIKAKVYKPPLTTYEVLVLNSPENKYRCCREYLETEVEYGLAHEIFLILETNHQKVCDDFLYEMEKYEDKRNTYFIEIEEDKNFCPTPYELG